MHGLLLDSVDGVGHGDARNDENGGSHVDDMGELGAQLPDTVDATGHCTTIGLRVPPRCEPTCLPHWKGVAPAHAQRPNSGGP